MIQSAKKVLFIVGTRPEAIKMAPLVHKFSIADTWQPVICSTGQHREMLNQVYDFFNIRPDYDLNVMQHNQSLSTLTAMLMKEIDVVLEQVSPDIVLVQGDTTSTMVGAIAAFYRKIPIGHIEAGLRSFDRFSPFPEETNRIVTSRVVDYHFAPTELARKNLLCEGLSESSIYLVGNTVVDALLHGLDRITGVSPQAISSEFSRIDFSKRMILVTGHRRESFGEPLLNICMALRELAHKDVEIVYPVHLNPNVLTPVHTILDGLANVHLLKPVSYAGMLCLMKHAYLILTDSGGIQEEAPSLAKPVLVMREVTERPEGVECGVARLVGTGREAIIAEVTNLLEDHNAYQNMATGKNPYGDGHAADRIVEIVRQLFA